MSFYREDYITASLYFPIKYRKKQINVRTKIIFGSSKAPWGAFTHNSQIGYTIPSTQFLIQPSSLQTNSRYFRKYQNLQQAQLGAQTHDLETLIGLSTSPKT